MTLTTEQARDLANDWRPRFDDPSAFATSWSRYMDYVKPGSRSVDSLEAWLRADAEADEVRAAGLPREPLVPVRQTDFRGCYHCHGWGFVRALDWSPDIPIGHPAFGRAVRCPACSNPSHRCEHCT